MDKEKDLEMLDGISENAEGTPAEQSVEEQVNTQPEEKTYTETEFNAKLDEVLGKKIARKEAKIRKEYEKKYGELENVLKAGTGKEDVNEIADSFRDFYKDKGVNIPDKPSYSDKDIKVLARAEAKDIIDAGFDEVVDELNRLTEIGFENMSNREKAVFSELASYRQNKERVSALAEIGVGKDIYDSKEFKEFSKKFNPDTPVTEIFEIYKQTKPKKEFKTMGSMKNSVDSDKAIKDFYTHEEALKFSRKDLDKNPELVKAIEKSMLKW